MKKIGNTRKDTTLYYGFAHRETGYNFFAYYMDDLPLDGKMHRDDTGVWYDVELDGTQDIMVGHAPQLTPEVLDSNYAEIVGRLPKDSRNKILNIGNYSDVAASWSIHPYINMEHKLVRLRFLTYPADRSCDSVIIEKIEIECRNKGQFYVVAPYQDNVGFRPGDERNFISLHDINPTENRDSVGIAPYVLPLDTVNRNKVLWAEGMSETNWLENPFTLIGGDMLVPQDSVFKMRLTYRQVLRNHSPQTGMYNYSRVTTLYRLPAPKVPVSIDPVTRQYVYRAGYVYNINLGVYGLRPIEVSTELDGWGNGGDIEIPSEQLEW
jgi:hypothetical protein